MLTTLTGKRARLWAAVLVTLSLLTLALSGCAKPPKPTGTSAPPKPASPQAKATQPSPPTPVSWEELQTTLEAAIKSNKFQQGAEAGAKSSPISPNNEEGMAKSYAFAVQFAKSLTRQQIEQMQQSSRLLFADLDKEQQNLLKMFADSYGPKNLIYGRAQDSYFNIRRYQQVELGPLTQLELFAPAKDNKKGCGVIIALDPAFF